MPLKFQNLWIFSKDGTPIVDVSGDKASNEILDPSRFGGFISAIKGFCQEVAGSELNSFIIGDSRITSVSVLKGQFVISCKSALDAKEKTIKKMCKVIADIFEEIYDVEDIENWNGDISFFDKFSTKLNIYFKMCEL